jgi:hypothetical protein
LRYYRAENRGHQWLGYVDLDGRVFQRLPFEEHEVFLGIYPMEKGLALLYEVDRPVRVLWERPGAREASGDGDR